MTLPQMQTGLTRLAINVIILSILTLVVLLIAKLAVVLVGPMGFGVVLIAALVAAFCTVFSWIL